MTRTVLIIFTVFYSILFLPRLVFSQTDILKGIILNPNTRVPIPFASIWQTKTTNGTVSNQGGEFSIVLKKAETIEIRISSIGYKTIFQKVKPTRGGIVIFLNPDEIPLQEVIIMPDSLLKNILSKAYQRILSNYHQLPIELTGFYREVQKSKNSYILVKPSLKFSRKAISIQRKMPKSKF